MPDTRPGLFARLRDAIRPPSTPKPVAQATVGTFAAGVTGYGKSASYVNQPGVGYSFAVGGYVPHEPFTQAWQKNMEGKNYRNPAMLAFSAVFACITIISQDMSKMPCRVMNIDPKDGVTETVAYGNPYHRLLRKPNSYQTPLDFMQMWTVSKLCRGNAYGLMVMDGRGVPQEVHILNPDRVKVLYNTDLREIYYEYNPHNNDLAYFGNFTNSKGTVIIPARFIIHDRINCLWHPLIGMSPLYAAAVSAATGGRILMNSERLFGNMARPSGVLTSSQEISDVTANRLKREFEANYSEGNIGRTAVLGDGLDWKQMVLTSVDSQLIEQLKWTIEDVARAFRVPMHLLADISRMTYKNAEQASQSYFSGCLQYHVEATEARFNLEFGLIEGQQHCAFDVSVLFRMDMLERFTAYGKGITSGVLSPNEARALEGRGPMQGGEEPRMQVQYVPLSTPIQPMGAGAPPAPAPAPADEEDDEEEDAPDDETDEEKQARIEDTEQELASQREMMDILARMSSVGGRMKKLREGTKV